jgi:hypothetical protein
VSFFLHASVSKNTFKEQLYLVLVGRKISFLSPLLTQTFSITLCAQDRGPSGEDLLIFHYLLENESLLQKNSTSLFMAGIYAYFTCPGIRFCLERASCFEGLQALLEAQEMNTSQGAKRAHLDAQSFEEMSGSWEKFPSVHQPSFTHDELIQLRQRIFNSNTQTMLEKSSEDIY